MVAVPKTRVLLPVLGGHDRVSRTHHVEGDLWLERTTDTLQIALILKLIHHGTGTVPVRTMQSAFPLVEAAPI